MPSHAPPAAGARNADASDDRADWQRRLRTTAWMLVVWAVATFGVTFFARQLDEAARGWPFSFWMAAQGSLLIYLALVVWYAARMERIDDDRTARHVD